MRVMYQSSSTFSFYTFLIIVFYSFQLCQNADCLYQPYQCDSQCLKCVYNPLINPYYNSSLATYLLQYNGPACCQCQDYKVEQFSYNSNESLNIGKCYYQPCGKDQDGTQLYWLYKKSYTTQHQCVYKCIFHICNFNNLMGTYTPFADPFTNICVCNCSNGLVGNTNSSMCQNQCPLNTFIFKRQNVSICTTECNDFSFPSNPQKLFYSDNITRRCEQYCTPNNLANVLRFGDNITKSCSESCQDGYGHPGIGICVKKCFGSHSITNFITNQCVKSMQEVTNQICQNSNCMPTIYKVLVFIAFSIAILLAVIVFGFLIYKVLKKKKSFLIQNHSLKSSSIQLKQEK